MRYLWYSMYAFVTALAIYALFFSPERRHQPAPSPVVRETPVPVTQVPAVPTTDVQIAILLDTSSSMDGLIEQARTQLWEIVAELQTDDKDQDRSVSVALYQYGNSRLDQRDGFIEKLSDLTPELDAVSVKLYSLSTSGGKEYAPQAILRATEELAWSDDDAVKKVIVVAGNEGFSQGRVTPEEAISAAQAKGIHVIPIFCANGGASSSGVASWRNAAKLAQIDLETIDPDKVVAKVETPWDAEIVRKYQELEATKLTYGSADYQREVESVSYQAAGYAQEASVSVQADRAIAQSKQVHRGDLVDDYGKSVPMGSLAPSALPTALQGLSQEEQAKEIQSRQIKRVKIQSEIDSLSKKRNSHRKGQQAVVSGYGDSSKPSLGESVRAQVKSY